MKKTVFSDEQISQAVGLRESGRSLSETSTIVTGSSSGGMRKSLGNLLTNFGFDRNPSLRDIYKAKDFSHIDKYWWYEFRAFFFGEGCLSLTRPNNGKSFLQPQMSISLRADDKDVLLNIQNNLGGSMQPYSKRLRENLETYGRRVINPQFRWTIVSIPNIHGILPYLENSYLPSKKLKEITLMKEFCELRLSFPLRMSQEQKDILIPYYYSLRDLKLYHS